MFRPVAVRCSLVACAVALVTACPGDDGTEDSGDDGPLACVEVDADACAPLYAPSWENVFEMTLMPDCATGGQACHASADALGAEEHGLFFADPESSLAILLEDRGASTFVTPDDPGCSQVVARLATDDAVRRMPPGLTLSDEEICSVVQWIAMGASP